MSRQAQEAKSSSTVLALCRASQKPAVDEEAAKTIGQRFGFDGLPKLLSRMLKGLQKQS